MFLKINKNKSGSYARIVESYRDKDGKPKHKTISNIGNIKNFGTDKIIELADSLLKFANITEYNLKEDLQELGRYNYGLFLVVDKILTKIGLKSLFQKIGSSNKSIDIYNTVLLMLMERFRKPSSKLATYNNQFKYLNLKNSNIPLSHLYRSLDKLATDSGEIKKRLNNSKKELKTNCDIVFYDVTTFYFDSQKDIEGSLRQKGFSKDGKLGKTQVVMGLLIDKNQIPIDYFLYSGDTYEGGTLLDAIDSLKKKYKIDKSVIVTDTGMMSSSNINNIESITDYSYIIGERYKSLPKKLKYLYLDISNYKLSVKLLDKSSGEEIGMKYFEYDYKEKGKRLIFTYSEKRAKKDKADREKRIEQALKLLQNPSLISKKESSYYLKQKSSKVYELDIERIEISRKYDGLCCIASNNKDLGVREILTNYKELYKIEHSFRSMKSYLETRPMYHWTDKRISGHICLCFISYYILRYLQRKLELESTIQSEREIRTSLISMEVSHIESISNRYYLTSKNTREISEILNVLQIKKLPKFIPEILINKYMST